MLKENKSLSIVDYLEIAWRRKWLIITPFLVVIPVAIALCFLLPKIYKASTTILVIPQNIPDSFIRSTVTMNPSEYLNVISQQIMSRTRLKKIIDELSLFADSKENIPIESLISLMRKNIELEVQSNEQRGVSSFTLSYTGQNPRTVMLTTNRIASLFIEENLKSREDQAKKTTLFLAEELEKLNKILKKQENTISEFKQRHIGSLPDQRDANLKMLDQLIFQRQRISDELNEVEKRRILIHKQLLQSENFLPTSDNEQTPLPLNSLQARINKTKSKIAELQNRYTEEHPDVVSAKAELQKLLAQPDLTVTNTQEKATTPLANEIDGQLTALNLEAEKLKREDILIKEKIESYQKRVELAPKLEQQLFSLTRDYQNTKDAYDDLMQKRLEAEQAEKLEIDQQGEQFKVLDSASLPSRPIAPDPMKIMLVGILLSCALGGGLVFLAEYLDQSFYTVQDIEEYLELPVIISLPLLVKKNRDK